MAWSTREIAELAGTTLRTVRHYHDIGLLPEPERASNGYKRYGVTDLVRLLRIRRLSDLGVPLSEIVRTGAGVTASEDTLRALDAEAAAGIERLLGIRAEIALMLAGGGALDLPPGTDADADHVREEDRLLIVVLSRILGPEVLRAWHALVQEGPGDGDAAASRFASLPADASEGERAASTEEMWAYLRGVWERYPPLRDVTAGAPRGPVFASDVLTRALPELYNPAQLDVLARMDALVRDARGPDG